MKKIVRRSALDVTRNFVVGIDAGGTKIRGVLMRGKKIIKRAEIFHKAKRLTEKVFLYSLFSILDSLVAPEVQRIGIGLPGTITNNRVVGAGNVKILTTIDIKKLVEKKYQTRVMLDNDAKVALRAELPYYKIYHSVFMLTLGTGIGGAWWLDGKIMRGGFGTAFETGQMVMDKSKKHLFELEDFCARKFFNKKGLIPIESEDKARGGNLYHKKLWREFGENLGIALANIINFIEPEIIIIGGGLSHAWPLFIKTTKATMKKLVLSSIARSKVKIVKTKSHKWIGAIGAAYMAQGK